MKRVFAITTPIYYVNDAPHLGHAYTTILADVLARFARLRGVDTFFQTGTDEHGQKVQSAASKRGVAPLEYVNETVQQFQKAWKELHIQPDDFVRTTQTRHIRVVQQVLADLWERGEIYQGEYEGWYCVPDERFWTEKDLQDGTCPDCGRPVERVVEHNYFFRMSAYQEWLVAYIQEHDDFIQPVSRRNEVLGFLRQPLGDLCISRPVSRLSWGIPLPFDAEYVTYVWFDALLNYVTAAGYGVDAARFEEQWPQTIHLIGKDILTTHSVYWPAMLKAARLPLPKTIFAHGWWVVDGKKMGKSLGNAVKPLDLAQIYGADAFRYFLMRDMVLGQDADFDPERIAARYQADLANNLGNLLHRLVNMTTRYCGGVIPEPNGGTLAEAALREKVEALSQQVFDLVDGFAVHAALEAVMDTLGTTNQYVEQAAPWKQAAAGNNGQVRTALYAASEALRICSVLLFPVLPEKALEVWRRLGWQPGELLHEGLAWGGLKPGSAVAGGEPLFPRIEEETPMPRPV
jgi:methionyl-tRNA synthetase